MPSGTYSNKLPTTTVALEGAESDDALKLLPEMVAKYAPANPDAAGSRDV